MFSLKASRLLKGTLQQLEHRGVHTNQLIPVYYSLLANAVLFSTDVNADAS